MIVIFTTMVVLIGGSILHSSLYNKIWIANGNDPPECMTPNSNVFTCPHTDAEYYHGFYWSNHIMTISILITGIVFGIKFYRKKNKQNHKKLICHNGLCYCLGFNAGLCYGSF